MATPSRPPSKPCVLEITVVSAKHLKNVNWRNGELKPYVVFWVDPIQRRTTKTDESGSDKPVWNERFVLPLSLPPQDSLLTLEIFHLKPSETPKPLVGTLRVQLGDLVDSDESAQDRTFELRRPSGRPHGKIRLKLALRDWPDLVYQSAPPSSYYYSAAPSPPPSAAPYSERDYRGYNPSLPSYPSHPRPPPPPLPAVAPPPPPSPHPYQYGGYSDPYPSYYPGYYSQQPPPPRQFFDRQPPSYGPPGPSAPVDYTPHDQKRGARMGLGTGLAAGAVSGAIGGLTLEEGLKYEEEKVAEKAESDVAAAAAAARSTYSDYRGDY